MTIHANSSSGSYESFKLRVSTSIGNLTVPQKVSGIVLNEHQSKIVVTDFNIGPSTLVYSTADVLTYAVFDGSPTVVLWVPTGESGEFLVKGAKNGTVAASKGGSNIDFFTDKDGVIVTFTQQEGGTVVIVDDVRVIILDRTYAYTFWAPALTVDPLLSPNETGKSILHSQQAVYIQD